MEPRFLERAIEPRRVERDARGERLNALRLENVDEPTIVADSVVDIGRFCRALSTGMDGGWSSVDYPVVRFEVHDVAAYPTTLPGAVQHNAWWDAMALRHMLEPVAA